MGEKSIDMLLLPVFKEMMHNLSRLQAAKKNTVAHTQIRRCLHALTVWACG